MNDLKIISKNVLSKNDIKTTINVINDSVGDKVITLNKEKPMAKKYTLDDGYTVYSFGFDRAINGDEADSIIGGLYNTLSFDFVAEINSDVVDYDDDIEENIEESDSVQHSQWVQKQVNDGWSYGVEFNEDSKKNPFIRPFHQLTKNQKNTIEKSKEKLGYYGVHPDYLIGDRDVNVLNDTPSDSDAGE